MVQQKVNYTRRGTEGKGGNNVIESTPSLSRPWTIIATYNNYKEADDHRVKVLKENINLDASSENEAKIRRSPKDEYTVRIRLKNPPSKTSKKSKAKKKKKSKKT